MVVRPTQADLAARINSYELAYRMQMAAPEALEIARERAPQDVPMAFIEGRAERMIGVEDRSFDCVVASLSLEEFQDLDAAISEIRRVLRPGGRFVASVTAFDRLRPVDAAFMGAVIAVITRHAPAALGGRAMLPAETMEAAVIGVDGHGDSLPLDYAFGDETFLALGMNGRTLNRTHGFPVRLIAPRYYGFKNVKWIEEIRFTAKPYFGTWPKMGYTKEPVIHTCSYIDRVLATADGLLAGGVAFAGSRGIRTVRVRADEGEWAPAEMEQPLSSYTWTRWRALIPVRTASVVEAQAQDGLGNWQARQETPLFPNGVAGPTVRRVSL